MSVLIKSLTLGPPVADITAAATNDYFNVIQAANTVYDLYTAPNETSAKRAAIVNSIRVANTHSANVKITFYVNRPTAATNGFHRRRLLTPIDMTLGPNQIYVDETELTLEPGDKIQGKADVANVIQYWISGVERDVT